MQWLGLLILLGILLVLFLAARYFRNTQETPNQPGSAIDDFYRSRGMGSSLSARDKLNEIAKEQRRSSSPARHRHKDN